MSATAAAAFPADAAPGTTADAATEDSIELSEVRLQTKSSFSSVTVATAADVAPVASTAVVDRQSRGVCFVLLPSETGGDHPIDEMFCTAAQRIPRTAKIVVLGIAPAPTRLMRMVPFGIASKNRVADGERLAKRVDRIVAQLKAGRHENSQGIVVAEGDCSTEHVVVDIAERHALSKVFLDRGAPSVLVFSDAEKIIRRCVPKSLPVTVFKRLPLLSAAALERRGEDTALHAAPAVTRHALVVVDPSDMSVNTPLPPALVEALVTSVTGDAVIIYASITLPEAATAMQLSSADWAAELKRTAKHTELQLADLKQAALRALGRRPDQGKGITLGTFVTERHYAAGVPKAINDFKASHVFLCSGFMRQYIFRGAYESLYGSEYERLMKSCPEVHFTVA